VTLRSCDVAYTATRLAGVKSKCIHLCRVAGNKGNIWQATLRSCDVYARPVVNGVISNFGPHCKRIIKAFSFSFSFPLALFFAFIFPVLFPFFCSFLLPYAFLTSRPFLLCCQVRSNCTWTDNSGARRTPTSTYQHVEKSSPFVCSQSRISSPRSAVESPTRVHACRHPQAVESEDSAMLMTASGIRGAFDSFRSKKGSH